MELSGDEQDALAASCGKCWAYPGEKCWVIVNGRKIRRRREHPHPERVDRASRRGILHGGGRVLLTRKAYQPREKREGWVT